MKQRLFLYEEFVNGEKTKRKTTAEKVVRKMRKYLNEDGSKVFKPVHYLTVQQVTSAFSRMSTQYRKEN